MEVSAIASWAWIPIVVWAAFAQTIRNAAQRSLVGDMGTLGATLVRFLYGLPFAGAWLLLVLVFIAPDSHLPALQLNYLLWLVLGAACQLGATACLLVAMKQLVTQSTVPTLSGAIAGMLTFRLVALVHYLV